jgi:uncharacterized membrane protein
MSQYALILGIFRGAPEKAAAYAPRLEDNKEDFNLVDIVVVTREGDGKPEVDQRSAKKGKAAGAGALIGGLVGVLAGPGGVALGAAAGAAAGAALKKLSHYNIPKAMREKVEAGLPENSSAVLFLMEAERSGFVMKDLEEAGAEVMHHLADRDFFDATADPGQSYTEE